MNYRLFEGDCLKVLKTLKDNSVSALVTDPPAGISFMGKDWDSDKGGSKEWIAWMEQVMSECLRVLKPGGHGLVWALPRTSHWTATALEQAGFEIRDVVTHLFGTGFPKSLDVSKAIDKAAGAERKVVGRQKTNKGESGTQTYAALGAFRQSAFVDVTAPSTDEAKQWSGWGTALKPASEHWILVRKPLSEKTVAANVLRWGTGGINIDGCRVEGVTSGSDKASKSNGTMGNFSDTRTIGPHKISFTGRFPANLILDETAAQLLDAQSSSPKGLDGASRFFYVAKASTSEKNLGLEGLADTTVNDGRNTPIDNPFQRGETPRKNTHPTVKSLSLMTYLIRMITPPGGIVLDPFTGSGSTGVAALTEGFKFLGIEREAEYMAIAKLRIEACLKKL